MKYRDMFFLLAKETIFLSFIDPLGCPITEQPFRFNKLILSVKGKKPSDAQTNDFFLK